MRFGRKKRDPAAEGYAAAEAKLREALARVDALDVGSVKFNVQDVTIGGSADKLYPVWWQFPNAAPDGGPGTCRRGP